MPSLLVQSFGIAFNTKQLVRDSDQPRERAASWSTDLGALVGVKFGMLLGTVGLVSKWSTEYEEVGRKTNDLIPAWTSCSELINLGRL